MTGIGSELQRKRILVTGAAGFIGSRLVNALLECGAEVVSLIDWQSTLTRIEPLLNNPRHNIVRCNFTDADSMEESRQKLGHIDLLAHLGIRMPRSASFFERVIEDINLNILPTIKLVDSLADSLEGLCFASSISVYGRPHTLPLREDNIPFPNSSYGATKLAIEDYLSAYGRATDLPVAILRYSTVYGPGELRHRAIPNFMKSLAEGQPPVVYSDGSETRDYVYIDDVVEATIRALVKRPSRVLLIGSGQSHSTLHIAREVIRLWSANVEPDFLPNNSIQTNIACDISAARESLGYSPRIVLEDGLSAEIQWYKKESLTPVVERGN